MDLILHIIRRGMGVRVLAPRNHRERWNARRALRCGARRVKAVGTDGSFGVVVNYHPTQHGILHAHLYADYTSYKRTHRNAPRIAA